MNRSHSFKSIKIIFGLLVIFNIAAPFIANAFAPPSIAGCPVFGDDNIWNSSIDTLPVDSKSQDNVTTIGASTGLHADFGSGLWDGGPIGIPYAIVSSSQPKAAVAFDYADESTGFSTTTAAYGAAVSNDIIKMLAANLQESLNLARPVSVTLKGGYSCGFNSNLSMTLLQGPVVIAGGKVTVENLIVVGSTAVP